MKKIAIFAYHLIPYQIPLYRLLANKKNLNSKVYFLDRMASKPFFNKEFNTTIYWDVDMLSGYDYEFLTNFTFNKNKAIIKRINFGIFTKFLLNKYDAVIITGYDTISSFIALLCAKVTKTKILFRTEAFIKTNQNKSILGRIKKILLPYILKNVDIIFYSCKSNKDYFIQFCKDEDKYKPLYCSVDNDFFIKIKNKIKNDKYNQRKKIGIKDDDICILYIGRLTKRKNPEIILKAIKKINNKKLKVIFVGDGHLKKQMIDFVEINNLKEQIFFTGFKTSSKICKYLNMSDIFILPSFYDPTPKVINEASLFSLPIIATDGVGLTKDFIKNNINGYVIESDNLNQLVTSIEKLYDRDRRIRFGNLNYEKALEWSPEQNIESIIKNI